MACAVPLGEITKLALAQPSERMALRRQFWDPFSRYSPLRYSTTERKGPPFREENGTMLAAAHLGCPNLSSITKGMIDYALV